MKPISDQLGGSGSYLQLHKQQDLSSNQNEHGLKPRKRYSDNLSDIDNDPRQNQ